MAALPIHAVLPDLLASLRAGSNAVLHRYGPVRLTASIRFQSSRRIVPNASRISTPALLNST